MASLSRQSNGRWRVQFVDGDERKGISLGKMQKRQAEQLLLRIESLISAKFSGLPMEQSTASWVKTIDQEMYSRIAATGLLQAREQRDLRLGKYIDAYVDSRPDVKLSTRNTWKRARKHLVEFFSEDRDLKTITAGDARDFFLKLQQKLSDNTARKTAGIAKLFFGDAVDREYLERNVFVSKSIPTAVRGNEARQYFITREIADKILKACPNPQWRLIFVLSRYGGLRCPSEHLALRWEHVDLDCKRLTVPSPKTEHHDGGESRVIPIFPEIEGPFLEVSSEVDELRPGNPWIITRYRNSTVNLRSQFERILVRAGVKKWPKLFHNLRSTRQTELIQEGHNPYVVCSVIGNSLRIMNEHYYQNTDSELEKMLQPLNSVCADRVQQVSELCSIVQNNVYTENKETH